MSDTEFDKLIKSITKKNLQQKALLMNKKRENTIKSLSLLPKAHKIVSPVPKITSSSNNINYPSIANAN